jgi:hypothetical protein
VRVIVVSVSLHSARTGLVSEIARLQIANDGTGPKGGASARRNYVGKAFVGRHSAALDKGLVSRHGQVRGFPSQRVHVWNLVAAMLRAMHYTEGAP